MRRNGKRDHFFEVERGRETVEYVCEYEVSPGEAPTGPTYDCGGTPGADPEVESKEVFFVAIRPCPEHRYKYQGRAGCRECVKVREPRPEMEDLVDDEELIEAWGEAEADDYYAAVDAEIDRRRDDAREGR